MTPVARSVEAIAAMSLGIALFAAWNGGWHAQLFGASISVRTLWRPLLVAVIAAAIRVWLGRSEAPRAAAWSTIAARLVSGSILTAGVLGWLAFLTPYV